MAANVTHFMPILNQERVSQILDQVPSWQNMYIKTAKEIFPIKSVYHDGDNLIVEFAEIKPEPSSAALYFHVNDMCYYFDGILIKQSNFVFAYKNLNQEQKRKIPRMNVPPDYPAFFALEEINGQALTLETKVLDVHSHGFQLRVDPSSQVKSNDKLVGTLRISKFPPIKLTGLARHCSVGKDDILVGVEINHREFGTENKLLELLAFYQHDVFYFNKKKAAAS